MTQTDSERVDEIEKLAIGGWEFPHNTLWLIALIRKYQTWHVNDLELIKEQAEIIREANAKLAEKNGK